MATLLNDGFGAIGEFKDSMLTEVQFQNLHGVGWILADGRSVTGSKYHSITSNTNVPDARGIARRGKNNGRVDGNQNPDGDVALGTFQADAFGSHTHIQDAHSHTQTVANAGGLSGALNQGTTAVPVTAATGTGSTTATNQSSGGNETRAKNISVNVFIRIN